MTAIAEAFVAIRPQAAGFQEELKAQLSGLSKVGAQVPVTANTAGLVQKTQIASKEASAKSSIAPKVQPNTTGLQAKLSSEFKKIAGIATGIFAGVFIVKGAADFLKGAVEKADAAQQAQLRLNLAFAKFPKLADISKSALLGLNEELSTKTRFDRDAFASGEAVLAQFNLTGQQVKQIIPIVADYAAKTGQDIPAAATAVGRALLGNTRGLKALGIQFKATGDTTKDFNKIFGLLQAKIGGFATQEGQTFSGRIAIMKNELGELQKTIGNALLPIFIRIANFLVTSFFPALSKIGSFLVEVFKPAFDLVRTAAEKFFSIVTSVGENVFKRFANSSQVLSAALKDIGPAIVAIGAAFFAAKILDQLSAFATAIKGIQKAAEAAGGGVGVIRAGFSALLGILTPTNLAIAGVAAVTFLLVKHSLDAQRQVQAFADALGQEAQGAKDATDQLLLNQFAQDGTLTRLNKLGISVTDFITAIKQGGPAFDAVNQSINNTGKGVGQFVDVLTPLGHITTATNTDQNKLIETLGNERDAFVKGSTAAGLKAKAQAELDKKNKDLTGSTKGLTGATNDGTSATSRATRSVQDQVAAIDKQNRAVVALQAHFKALATSVDHFKTSLDATLGAELNLQDATSKYDQDLASLRDSLKKNGASFDLNTQKGRDNSQALRTLVGDIEDQIGALVKSGKLTADDAAQKNVLISKLRELERRFPALSGQVDSYIAEVKKTPVTQSTSMVIKTDAAKKTLTQFQQDLRDFGGRIAKEGLGEVKIGAKTQDLKATVSLNTSLVNLTAAKVEILAQKKMAGGPVGAFQPFIVGERGPELFVPNTSGTIVPNQNLKPAQQGLTDAQIARIIAAIDKLVALRPITVNEVAQNPVATAESVAARIGLAGVR